MGKIKFRRDLAQSMTDPNGKAMVDDLRTKVETELDVAVEEWMVAIGKADIDSNIQSELHAAKDAVLETWAKLTLTAQRGFSVDHSLRLEKPKKSV